VGSHFQAQVISSPEKVSSNCQIDVKFQVFTGASMKMTVFWGVALCGLAETDQCFRGAYCQHHQGDRYKTVKYINN
jgi:hypothetical protein